MGSESARVRTQEIFGVEVLLCHLDLACDLIEARIANRAPTRVAFLNANLSLLAVQRPDLREALKAFVVFNDGFGVDIANRVLNGSGFPANLNGTDLVPHLLGRMRTSLRIFLLGAKPETLQKAVRVIRHRWPHHSVVGQAHGYLDAGQEALIPDVILKARPDIVLVAMGNPKQELWIAQHVPRCAPCCLGVGALFDFLAGDVKRAPRWIRAVRCEWMFRLALEPRRLWRRYLIGNAQFIAYLAVSWVAQTTGSSRKPAGETVFSEFDTWAQSPQMQDAHRELAQIMPVPAASAVKLVELSSSRSPHPEERGVAARLEGWPQAPSARPRPSRLAEERLAPQDEGSG
jgi:exopolysaccharide biosynthesis WecB/TagA/CpsF family protein